MHHACNHSQIILQTEDRTKHYQNNRKKINEAIFNVKQITTKNINQQNENLQTPFSKNSKYQWPQLSNQNTR